jgi:hypothetical protein
MRCPARFVAAVALAAASLLRMPGVLQYVNGCREFFPPLVESEGCDLRQADAREARALISSLRHRGHGGEYRASL